jgi:hypothetical protein
VGYNNSQIIVTVVTQTQYPSYRVGVRSLTYDWDTVFTMNNAIKDTLQLPPANSYFVNVMSRDSNGIESPPIAEYSVIFTGTNFSESAENSKIELLQNKPNPFDEATYIPFLVKENFQYEKAEIEITDRNGRQIKKYPVTLTLGINEVLYTHGYGMNGVYFYSLVIDGKKIATKSMVFAN